MNSGNNSLWIQFLKDRNLYDNSTSIENINKSICSDSGLITYIGFDLTGDGLHVGHLSILMCIKEAIKNGHHCIILLGGGTTYIGDPSGKNATRKMLTDEQISSNKQAICRDVINILLNNDKNKTSKIELDLNSEVVFKGGNFTILDNYYWLKSLNYIDFLRDVGIHFSVNKMIKMDSMNSRLNKEDNLSFIEFNYPLLQSYDFYHLNKKYKCNCQIGGSDQWGNMIRGVELVNKMNKQNVHCITIPLTLRADGTKMGKSENGAIWLSNSKLSSESYWQYFRNVDDKDVISFLKIFTNLSIDRINEITNLDINRQKEILATEATAICRGTDIAKSVEEQMQKLFSGVQDISSSVNVKSGIELYKLIINLGFAKSNNEARRLILGNGVKINNTSIIDQHFIVTLPNINNSIQENLSKGDALDSNENIKNNNQNIKNTFIISVGKKSKKTIKIID